jgi:hypothetical protein
MDLSFRTALAVRNLLFERAEQQIPFDFAQGRLSDLKVLGMTIFWGGWNDVL